MINKISFVLLSVLAVVGCNSPKATAGCDCDCDCDKATPKIKPYHGPTFEVSSWKGEVSYHKIHDKFTGEVLKYFPEGSFSKDGVTVEFKFINSLIYNQVLIQKKSFNIINTMKLIL